MRAFFYVCNKVFRGDLCILFIFFTHLLIIVIMLATRPTWINVLRVITVVLFVLQKGIDLGVLFILSAMRLEV